MNANSIFQSGDIVLIITLILLILMSVASWSIAVLKTLEFHRTKQDNNHFLDFLARSHHKLAKAYLADRNLKGPMARITNKVLKVRSLYYDTNHALLRDQISLDDFIARQLRGFTRQEMEPYQKGLSILASVGSMAPFIGLFGTVIGIYHALIGISALGQISIAEVAGPIGEALIATAIGLITAVPAVLFYNYFLRRSKKLAWDLAEYSDELHTYLLSENNDDISKTVSKPEKE